MLEVQIELRALPGRGWLVDLHGAGPRVRAEVPPLKDGDLAGFPEHVPREVDSWAAFLQSLLPNSPFRPGPATLRAVGGLIFKRVLRDAGLERHIEHLEHRSKSEQRPLRVLFDIDEEHDPILACLPLELAHDGSRFLFKDRIPAIRCVPHGDAQNLRLRPGARVLIATAHADSSMEPTRESLEAHAMSIAASVRAAGFDVDNLKDATPDTLRHAILSGPRIDLLYVACHGLNDPDRAGWLTLRERALAGDELAGWLEQAHELGRAVQAVILCACSSAAPRNGEGSSGMAQWLVHERRALAALGFRGPVKVSWSLELMEQLFRRLGEGVELEDAFIDARRGADDADPQWALPLLYAPRRDLGAPASARARPRAVGAPIASLPPLAARLPNRPRPYFTGRAVELEQLRRWAKTPGAAEITAVEGQGGIGKSELARKLVYDQLDEGRLVIWLERADRDVFSALLTLISLRRPEFQASPDATEEDLIARVRAELGPYAGMLVLDDIVDRTAVDRLTPGGRWNVLVTTRIHALLPGALGVEVKLLSPAEALLLLSRVAWDADEPPADERAAAARLVERLGRLPLALEMAGGTLRDHVTVEKYVESLQLGEGVAAADRRVVHRVLLRSLADLSTDDERVFLALSVLPEAGATAGMVAETLDQPCPTVTRRLDRLVRHNLVTWAPEVGRYGLHPLVRDAVRDRARGDAELWSSLHLGAAKAIEKTILWLGATIDLRHDVVRERWRSIREVFDSIDLEPWLGGAPGGKQIVTALAVVARQMSRRPAADEEKFFSTGEAILSREATSTEEDGWRWAYFFDARSKYRFSTDDLQGALLDMNRALRLFSASIDKANVLVDRATLRIRLDGLDAAAHDLNDALVTFRARGNKTGQASALDALGSLSLRRGRTDEALGYLDEAISLYASIKEDIGQANALVERANVHFLAGSLKEAMSDVEQGIRFYHAAGAHESIGKATRLRGEIRAGLNDIDGAAKDLGEALALFQVLGSRIDQANTLVARAVFYLRTSNLDGAAKDLEDAIRLSMAIGDRLGQANALHHRGELNIRRGALDEAAVDLTEALSLYTLTRSERGRGKTLLLRGKLFTLRGEFRDAEEDLDGALSLFDTLKNDNLRANALLARGHLHACSGNRDAAISDLDAALGIYSARGVVLGQANVHAAYGGLEHSLANMKSAAAHYGRAVDLYRSAREHYGLSQTLARLAHVYFAERNRVEAEAAATEALELGSRNNNAFAIKLAGDLLGEIEYVNGVGRRG